MILTIKNFYNKTPLFINLVFCFFPISFIFGNLITNINSLLFCGLGIYHLRKKILKIKFDFVLKIIFLLFFVIFFSTSLSFIKSLYFEGYEYINLVRLIKSIIFFRFLLIIIIIYLLSEYDVINFKYFFVTAAFSTAIVSIDVIFQSIFGFNIIGLKSHGHHNSGFFRNELIAGGFIQNFSFFLILFIAFVFKNKFYLRFVLITLAICILNISIIVSGNKMPLILFFLGLLLLFLLDNKLRKIILVNLLFLFLISSYLFSKNLLFKNAYIGMYNNIKTTITGSLNYVKTNPDKTELTREKIVNKKKDPYSISNIISVFSVGQKYFVRDKSDQARLLLTALDTWKKNKIFGNGIKSFRIECAKFPSPEYNLAEDLHFVIIKPVIIFPKNRLCSNHPHNYYFEILTETGIVGFILILIIAAIFLAFIFKKLRFFKENNIESFFLLAATISLFLEAFPLKSTGSIFTTNNATYIIIISSIILCHKKITEAKNFH